MGKKKQNKGRTIQDATSCCRISFLHQAAHIVPLPLQRHYLTTAKVAMKKTMLKLEPKLKRLTCRRCAALLAPHSGNAKTRLAEAKGGRGDEMLETECVHCHIVRRIRITEGYVLYTEREPVEITQIN